MSALFVAIKSFLLTSTCIYTCTCSFSHLIIGCCDIHIQVATPILYRHNIAAKRIKGGWLVLYIYYVAIVMTGYF